MSNWTEKSEDVDEPIPLFATLTLPNRSVYKLTLKDEKGTCDAEWVRIAKGE